ncbi:MAG: transposase family protein [Bacilli bacterium]|nr:transposase family protein [Bacilli bacterium]
MAKKSKELENIIEIFEYEERIDEEKLEKMEIDVKFIYQMQENALLITDERDTDYVLHSVESIILTLIFAIIANCNTFVQIHLFMCKHFDWLQKHIIFDNGIPSISTIKRVVSG